MIANGPWSARAFITSNNDVCSIYNYADDNTIYVHLDIIQDVLSNKEASDVMDKLFAS